MTAPELDIENVKPLSFLLEPAIHRENKRVLQEEHDVYRALTWIERWRLKRYVAQLRRKLRHYNMLVAERERLAQTCAVLKRQLESSTDASERARITQQGKEALTRGRAVTEQLAALSEDHKRYQHYQGWLDYERRNWRELKQRAKDEKAIKKGMDKESRYLKTLMIDVFKNTHGCHHMVSNGKGKTRAKAPHFFKVQTAPDAHYFWLDTSKRTLFGWRWMLPYEVNIDTLVDDTVVNNLKAATRRDVAAVYSEQGQLMYRVSRLDSPDALPRKVKWSDTRQFYPENKRDQLPYCIGVAEKRKFKWFDFASDPHILVAGKTQSGKSNLVNGIIATCVQTHSPDELRIVLIDQKGGVEFAHWANLPHVLWKVAKTIEDVQPTLNRVVQVMRKRLELLEKAKKKDIAAYNRSTDDRLPRLLVVIDEMNTFVGLGALTEEIHNLIMLLVSQGRAVGIHVIAATQHPEVKVIPGRIKTNMSVRMSGAMPSIVASQIVLDTADAAKLPNIPGRFIAVVGLQTLTVQVPLISDEHDIPHVVSKALNDYPETSDELRELANAPRLKVWDEDAVIEAALEWTNGSLSGQKIHRLLGSESPGERALNTLCKRVIDRAAASGRVIQFREEAYEVRRNPKGKGWIIVSYDTSDVSDVGAPGASSVGTVSEASPGQPLAESAAD
jgi:S-DNA-T family DNA segregation ATPase FtsK/SpoIIIE